MPTHGITPHQRQALNKLEPNLPPEMQQALQAARANTAPGKQKDLNAMMHALVPSDIYNSYGIEPKIDKLNIARFRTFQKTRKVSIGQAGFSQTEITGNGMLGSMENLNKGLLRGDVTMKVIKGREMYFMDRVTDEDIVEDNDGRTVEATDDSGMLMSDDQKSELLDKFSMQHAGDGVC